MTNINLKRIPDDWTAALVPVKTGDIEIFKFTLKHEGAAVLPQCAIGWEMPCTDICGRWTCGAKTSKNLPPDWTGASYPSNVAVNSPIVCLFARNDSNRLTFAFSEARRAVQIQTGVREENCQIIISLELFTMSEAPLDYYEAYLLLDKRPILYSDAIADTAKWFETFPEYTPAPVPEAAFNPIFSSWYTYHQNLFDAEIEKECQLASAMNMKGIIIDDGWQTDDNNRGYAFCGDWEISQRRFPDMAAHVRRVHAMGMKYLVWYSVPFMGFNSKSYERFKGKYLYEIERHKTAVLDPRFPEVREYLIGIYEKAMREWDLDGFKLDFIDSFGFRDGHDPAVEEDYAGRDIKCLPLAVDALLSEVMRRLRAIKPDILVEFRQAYVGPAIRKYGNMFRAGDCPCDYLDNRTRTIDLRLTSGSTAVHSDMLEWHPSETAESAALQLLNVLFAVPQISVKLEKLPDAHRRMLKFWLDFYMKHRETLMKGHLVPHSPDMLYPLVSAEGEAEDIHAIYSDTAFVTLRQRKSYIVNATAKDSVVVEFPQAPTSITIFTCTGEKIAEMPLPQPGIVRLAVPASGFAVVCFK